MSYGLAIHTTQQSLQLLNGRRSFDKIQTSEGTIFFRVPLSQDEYVVERKNEPPRLGSDFESLISKAVMLKTPFTFCYFLLPHNDTDDDIISLFSKEPAILASDNNIIVNQVYRLG